MWNGIEANNISDVSIKEIMLALDADMHFIIEDLDERRLFIETSQLDAIKAKIAALLEENIFKPEESD